jgi:hypothetical protein
MSLRTKRLAQKKSPGHVHGRGMFLAGGALRDRKKNYTIANTIS